MIEHGLGAIPSPPDPRDLVASATDLERLAGAVPLPAHYLVDPLPPVRDQGLTPQCVAYSSAYEKAKEDRDDFGRWIDFNESRFFYEIGGGPNGAVARNALNHMLNVGYPENDSTPSESKHRIASYLRIDLNRSAIKRAIHASGGALVVIRWFDSWTHLYGNNVTPPPAGSSNGHEFYLPGWDAYEHAVGLNSWGSGWGDNGKFLIPFSYIEQYAYEVWTAADVANISQLYNAKLNNTGIRIRRKTVLGDDGKLSGSLFARATSKGIKRESDGVIIASPWDKPFEFHGFRGGAKHGIEPYPHSWAVLVIGGRERCVARPLIHLVKK